MTDIDRTNYIIGCPVCGDQPEVSSSGTCIDIECCVSMSRQKSDYLTLDERMTWSNDALSYSADAERKAMAAVIEEWNTRQGDPLPHQVFNTFSVYEALSDNASRRTSVDNVGDTLDALVRLVKKEDM